MNLKPSAIVSVHKIPYIVAQGSPTHIKYRNWLIISLYTGARWSDKEFDLPITLDELSRFYNVELQFEGYLNGKEVR